MLLKIIIINIFALFIILPCFGALESVGIYSGEERMGEYYGPLDPAIIKDKSQTFFKDKIFYDRYIEKSIGQAFFDLERFYSQELKLNATCPEYYYKKHSEYIKYLFRLITLSYLYESVAKSHYTLYSLGGDLKHCPRDFRTIFKRCNPKTSDMKKFVKRASFFFDRKTNHNKYTQMDSRSKERWLSTFEFRKTSQIPSSRISSWCMENKISCQSLDIKTAIKGLSVSCSEDTQLAEQICNEGDDLFGMSGVGLASKLLVSSHSKDIINKGGYGHSCVERFSESNNFKENRYYQMKNIFDVVSLNMKNNGGAYLQGELFLPGSLKEFDDLGLKNFIFKKKVIANLGKPKKLVKKFVAKVEALAMPKPKVKKVQKRKPKPKIVVRQKIVKKIQKSYFESRYLYFLKNNSKKVILRPKMYKKSYSFSKAFIAKMQGPLEVYKTRVAISDMLKYDKIGSFENPFQISFIKYLIDYSQHQGLFNIVSIMGESFYIKNDIEKKKKPIFIELLNDESTSYSWQLAFIQPIKKKK